MAVLARVGAHTTPKRRKTSLKGRRATRRKPMAIEEDEEGLPCPIEKKRVVIVRHGQSTWNAQGRIQGSTDDSVLTARGEAQAEAVREMLQDDDFAALYHSPLQRAAQTAEVIWSGREGETGSLPELREIDLHSFEGLLKSEGKRLHGERYTRWQSDPVNFEVDGHYPVPELWQRARACWEHLLSTPHSSMLVVAHNAVLQSLVATAVGLGPHYFRRLQQSNCGVSVLDFGPPSFEGGPCVAVERLNQSPSSPLASSDPPASPGGRITLLVHGQDEGEREGLVVGRQDYPLSRLGRVQALRLAGMIREQGCNRVYTSPLGRAVQTAETIADAMNLERMAVAEAVSTSQRLNGGTVVSEGEEPVQPVVLEGLKDIGMGSWEAKPEREIRERDPDNATLWIERPREAQVDGMESLSSLFERASHVAKSVFSDLAKGNGNIALVTHPAVAKATVCQLLGMGESGFRRFRFDYGGVSVIDVRGDGTTTLRCANYTQHLGRWALPVSPPTSQRPEAAVALSVDDF